MALVLAALAVAAVVAVVVMSRRKEPYRRTKSRDRYSRSVEDYHMVCRPVDRSFRKFVNGYWTPAADPANCPGAVVVDRIGYVYDMARKGGKGKFAVWKSRNIRGKWRWRFVQDVDEWRLGRKLQNYADRVRDEMF